jgi:peptide deformylase
MTVRAIVEIGHPVLRERAQHDLDHLDGTLFVDRVTDPRTLTTWEQFERFHRDEWLARVEPYLRKRPARPGAQRGTPR